MNNPRTDELDRLQSGKIYIAGHRGMVGSAIVRRLRKAGCERLLFKSHKELDLTKQAEVESFIADERPEFMVIAAAKVGGIMANNTQPACFIYENTMIAANLIHAAWQYGVQRLLFLGSSCIYPRLAEQPMKENALLTGTLEPTNEPYAVAKIAGIKLCESYNRQYGTDYRSIMPTNLYGENDNFDLESSHVLPALIRKFHEAKISHADSVEIWGSGAPRREFLHVDDLADASLFVLQVPKHDYENHTQPSVSHINVGTGTDITIRELAELVRDIVGFGGTIEYNRQYPDGTPRKLLDVSLLGGMGWQARIDLRDGITRTYEWFRANH